MVHICSAHWWSKWVLHPCYEAYVYVQWNRYAFIHIPAFLGVWDTSLSFTPLTLCHTVRFWPNPFLAHFLQANQSLLCSLNISYLLLSCHSDSELHFILARWRSSSKSLLAPSLPPPASSIWRILSYFYHQWTPL